MEITIRKGTQRDIPLILDLLYQLGRPSPIDDEFKIFKNKMKDYFSNPQKAIFVAETDSTIVGLVSIILLSRLNRTKLEMYIPELIVTKKLRYSGIGKKLIQYCLEFAREKDCYRIRLESGNQRKESHKFYKNLGFAQIALTFSKNLL